LEEDNRFELLPNLMSYQLEEYVFEFENGYQKEVANHRIGYIFNAIL